MKKITLVVLSLFASLGLASAVVADDHAPQATMEGSFTTVMMASPDIGKYVDAMKKNVAPFQAMGASGAGYCVTQTGHEYDGQMMVWSAFSSVQAALVGGTKYDPSTAPRMFAKLRDVKYSVTWKPLKPFKLMPGYERVQRVRVAPQNVPAFLAAMTDFETALQEGGHPDFFNGVFLGIGGGTHEAQTLMLRSITPDAESHGAMFDEYFAGEASWAGAYLAVAQLIESVESDNFEICEQIYFGD